MDKEARTRLKQLHRMPAWEARVLFNPSTHRPWILQVIYKLW